MAACVISLQSCSENAGFSVTSGKSEVAIPDDPEQRIKEVIAKDGELPLDEVIKIIAQGA